MAAKLVFPWEVVEVFCDGNPEAVALSANPIEAFQLRDALAHYYGRRAAVFVACDDYEDRWVPEDDAIHSWLLSLDDDEFRQTVRKYVPNDVPGRYLERAAAIEAVVDALYAAKPKQDTSGFDTRAIPGLF